MHTCVHVEFLAVYIQLRGLISAHPIIELSRLVLTLVHCIHECSKSTETITLKKKKTFS